MESGATAGVDVRGAAPATRDTDLLNPVNMVQTDQRDRPLRRQRVRPRRRHRRDPLARGERHRLSRSASAHVPIGAGAAVLFDLGVGNNPKIRPTADCGYQAAGAAATTAPVVEGNVGAGAGATVGKFGGAGRAMKAGIGSAAITLPDGLIVSAIVAVNAVGDIIDPATGTIVAGVRNPDDTFADARRSCCVTARRAAVPRAGENTTIGVIATNAVLTKTQATRVAQMAHDGYARAISPSHTPNDGDAIFTIATGAKTGTANAGLIGELAAEVMADAIVRSVRQATGVPGYPGRQGNARSQIVRS